MKKLLKTPFLFFAGIICLTSCENEIDEPLESIETNNFEMNEIEIDEDTNFVYTEDSKSESEKKAKTVQLGKVVVFLNCKSTASGTLKVKVVRSSDNKVLATSASLNVSALRKNNNGYTCSNQSFTKVSFNLNTTTAKVTVGEKYRVEVHCSKTAGSSEKNTVYWAMQNANVYANGCSTYTDIPLKHCGFDFSFESWNFNNNNVRKRDQSQYIRRCARPVNSGNKKIAGQEFIVGQ